MTEIVKFNVGGHRYEVSRSMLSLHPQTMLAKSASEQWQTDPEKEIFIDRDGATFGHVLNYLRDGKVSLPITIRKETLLSELEYYGVDGVEETTINEESGMKSAYNMKMAIEIYVIHTLVSECIDAFFSSGSPSKKLYYTVKDKKVKQWLSSKNPNVDLVLEKANVHLSKVGLKLIHSSVIILVLE